jgi:hypothetical protein
MARSLARMLSGTSIAKAPHGMVWVRTSVGIRATTAPRDCCDSSQGPALTLPCAPMALPMPTLTPTLTRDLGMARSLASVHSSTSIAQARHALTRSTSLAMLRRRRRCCWSSLRAQFEAYTYGTSTSHSGQCRRIRKAFLAPRLCPHSEESHLVTQCVTH